MTHEESLRVARLRAASRALKEGARASWEEGRLREAARLFARHDVTETRALELEHSIRFPDAPLRADFSSIRGEGDLL